MPLLTQTKAKETPAGKHAIYIWDPSCRKKEIWEIFSWIFLCLMFLGKDAFPRTTEQFSEDKKTHRFFNCVWYSKIYLHSHLVSLYYVMSKDALKHKYNWHLQRRIWQHIRKSYLVSHITALTDFQISHRPDLPFMTRWTMLGWCRVWLQATWTSAKPLTLFPTSFSMRSWQLTAWMGVLFAGLKTGWKLDAKRGGEWCCTQLEDGH